MHIACNAAAGMLAELVYGRADLTLFPLTILQSRTEVIDFTYSYVDGGIGLLVSAAKQSSSTLGFLRPFSWEARIYSCCCLNYSTNIALTVTPAGLDFAVGYSAGCGGAHAHPGTPHSTGQLRPQSCTPGISQLHAATGVHH